MNRSLLLLSTLCFLAAFGSAEATLRRPTGGPLELRIEVPAASEAQLRSGGVSTGTPIDLILSFKAPLVPLNAPAEVYFKPLDGVIRVAGGTVLQESTLDSTMSGATKLVVPLTNTQPGTRMRIPFTFSSLGQRGAGVDAELRVLSGEASRGFASLTFAVNGGQTVSLAGVDEINAIQANEMRTNDAALSAVVFSARQLPFNPNMARSQDSEPVSVVPDVQ